MMNGAIKRERESEKKNKVQGFFGDNTLLAYFCKELEHLLFFSWLCCYIVWHQKIKFITQTKVYITWGISQGKKKKNLRTYIRWRVDNIQSNFRDYPSVILSRVWALLFLTAANSRSRKWAEITYSTSDVLITSVISVWKKSWRKRKDFKFVINWSSTVLSNLITAQTWSLTLKQCFLATRPRNFVSCWI